MKLFLIAVIFAVVVLLSIKLLQKKKKVQEDSVIDAEKNQELVSVEKSLLVEKKQPKPKKVKAVKTSVKSNKEKKPTVILKDKKVEGKKLTKKK